ncbi:uncharacterized protein [Clytia hemisphaerica]|uniref:Uncharacterized protein n=1 Tax=Clytia hemisphaerica TaxID=252671 RepID=A0A7M5XB61_9CNID
MRIFCVLLAAFACTVWAAPSPKDNDELAEKLCKGLCIHLKRNCGQMLGCGNARFDVSKHCPETCAAPVSKDNNALAEKVCKGQCIHLKRNCGQMLGCGNARFDVSKHCPETCA